jgi:hypothetical protein
MGILIAEQRKALISSILKTIMIFLFLNGLLAIPNVSFADDINISPSLPTRVSIVYDRRKFG